MVPEKPPSGQARSHKIEDLVTKFKSDSVEVRKRAGQSLKFKVDAGLIPVPDVATHSRLLSAILNVVIRSEEDSGEAMDLLLFLWELDPESVKFTLNRLNARPQLLASAAADVRIKSAVTDLCHRLLEPGRQSIVIEDEPEPEMSGSETTSLWTPAEAPSHRIRFGVRPRVPEAALIESPGFSYSTNFSPIPLESRGFLRKSVTFHGDVTEDGDPDTFELDALLEWQTLGAADRNILEDVARDLASHDPERIHGAAMKLLLETMADFPSEVTDPLLSTSDDQLHRLVSFFRFFFSVRPSFCRCMTSWSSARERTTMIWPTDA